MKTHYTDSEIVAAIRGGEKAQNAVVHWVYYYEAYQKTIFGYIRKHSKSQLEEEEIDEIYRNGIMVLVSNVLRNKYKNQDGNSIGSYLFGICRLLWINQLKKKSQPLTEGLKEITIGLDDNSPENSFLNEEKKGIVKQLLKSLKEPCRTVIQLWALSYSMAEIATEVGYKSAGMARKKKAECWKKLLNIVKAKPNLTTYLKD